MGEKWGNRENVEKQHIGEQEDMMKMGQKMRENEEKRANQKQEARKEWKMGHKQWKLGGKWQNGEKRGAKKGGEEKNGGSG